MKLDTVAMHTCKQRLLKQLPILFLFALLTGCAATSTTVMDEELVTNPKPMSSYKSLIIRKFDLKRELYSDVPESGMGSQERRYSQVPAKLAEQILRYVKAKRIYKEVSLDGATSADSLILKGKFTKMGRFRISLEAVLLDGTSGQEVAYCRQTLWDVFDTTEGIGRLGRDVADFIDRIQYK
jgi:hypothetical protein